MPDNTDRLEVPGSNKAALPTAHMTGDTPADEQFQVTVRVRRQTELPSLEAYAAQALSQRTYLTKAEFAASHGASAEDLAKVAEFAKANGLTVDDSDASRRSVLLSGTAADFQKAFSVELKNYSLDGGTYRGRSGPIFIPSDLKDIVVGVFGLDNRPFAEAHYRIHPEAARHAKLTAFYPAQIAKLYNFPTDVTGQGQKIGIIELGGGFRQSELDTYFAQAGVSAPPQVSVASFAGGGTNSPGTNALDPANPDVEVMLDIQVAGSVAPGAEIVVYFAKDASDQGFLDVMTAAVTDPNNDLSVISISWGGPEGGVGTDTAAQATKQFQDNFDQTLQTAAHLGITVCTASGDSGSADFAANNPNWDDQAHVDFPSSSPHVLACGGTRITVAKDAITHEVVWHPGANVGSGGGVSRYFALPTFQADAHVPPAVNPKGPVMRGVPDVCGDAASESGYRVLCDGQEFPDPTQGLPGIGGTSAVAPLWAGLIALLAQSLSAKLGWINPQLYQIASDAGAFNDITTGNNGDYHAVPGWDPCTGLGSPDGKKLQQSLSK
ncbi:MAG: S53 family peptidase [Janthinobacterium lividum]